MAGSAFKQSCPSCEHPVLIRDVGLVGKKIECPKCKYRFLVQKPAGDEAPKTKPDAKAKPPAKPAGKPAKAGALRDFDDDEPEVAADSGKSKKRLYAGLGLAVVGLVVLGLASFVILGNPFGGGGGRPKNNTPVQPQAKGPIEPDPDGEPKIDDKKPPEVKKKIVEPVVPPDEFVAVPPGPELTNLLPNDSEHVFHGFFKDLFDPFSPFRGAILGDTHVFADQVFKPHLGFAVSDIDDFIRADRFTDTPWTYTVLHFKTKIDQKAITDAFGLKRLPTVRGHEFFRANKPNPWFDQLSRVAVGVPQWLRLVGREDRPLCIRFHNPQTLIVADDIPMKELCKNDLQFPLLSGVTAPVEPKVEAPVAKADPDVEKDKEKAKDKKPASLADLADPFTDSVWSGTETRPGRGFGPITMKFNKAAEVLIETPVPGTNVVGPYQITQGVVQIHHTLPSKYNGAAAYTPAAGWVLAGTAQNGPLTWKFAVKRLYGLEGIPAGKIPEKKVVVAKKSDLPQVRSKSYLTVKPKLKEVLDRIEAGADETEKPLYSTATDLESARVPDNKLPAEYRGTHVWRGKQIWDFAMLLEERRPRIPIAGSGLTYKDARNYQYRAEFECGTDADARDVQKFCDETAGPELVRNVERYLQHKIEMPRPDPVLEAGEGKGGSKYSASLREQSVDVRVDLVFDNAVLSRVQALTALFALAARAEVDLLSDPRGRQLLGQAAITMAAQGIPDRFPSGSYPPGTFKRLTAAGRGGNTPYYRVSWMASLLPFLGHDTLAGRIDYSSGWRDPANWLAARTIVPAFQDPSYPDASRSVYVPGIGVAPAATHIVGIAGVGLDAADYARDDPTKSLKRGVFGYDRSATVQEIQQGRGASTTIMMMQIPHDGLTGVSPWIAGGGSTLRGVPEKDSIAPFVLTKDKNGKDITVNGRRGTYAVMADGSVRFIDATISDDVLKAMVTIHSPSTTVDNDKVIAVPDPKK